MQSYYLALIRYNVSDHHEIIHNRHPSPGNPVDLRIPIPGAAQHSNLRDTKYLATCLRSGFCEKVQNIWQQIRNGMCKGRISIPRHMWWLIGDRKHLWDNYEKTNGTFNKVMNLIHEQRLCYLRGFCHLFTEKGKSLPLAKFWIRLFVMLCIMCAHSGVTSKPRNIYAFPSI